MPLRRRCPVWPLAALLAAFLPAPPAVRAAPFVIATSQVCTGAGAGDCETAPSVGRNETASLSRSWGNSEVGGFYFLASTEMIADYCAFSASAAASGYDVPDSGPTFLNSVTRIGRSLGHFADGLTAGAGGAPGYLRIPLHISGGANVSWQNGGGVAQLSLSCYSTPPGGATYLGHCDPVQFNFLDDETLDTVVNLDLPIVLGSPFEYRVSFTVSATTGHAAGDPIPFQGLSEAQFQTAPFSGALVLDAAKQVIAGAPISASDSGFVYTPEPGGRAAGVGALLGLAVLALGRAHSLVPGRCASEPRGLPGGGVWRRPS